LIQNRHYTADMLFIDA